MGYEAATVLIFATLLLFCNGFRVPENERSKRGIQLLCAAELYEAPISNCCKIPIRLPENELKTCLAAQKAKSLKTSEGMCTFDCIYKSKNWISAEGVFDLDEIISALTLSENEIWTNTITESVKNCSKQIENRGTNLKTVTGYKSNCNPQAYFMQNCLVLNLYRKCPSNLKANASFIGINACPMIINSMSATCSPFAHYRNILAEAGGAIVKKAQEISSEVNKVVKIDELGKAVSREVNSLSEKLGQLVKKPVFKQEALMKKFFGK